MQQAATQQDPDLLARLGVLRAQQGRPDRALRLLRQAVALSPHTAELHNNLGMAQSALRRWDEAIASFRRALELRPGYAIALNNLGIAHAALGSHDDAVAAYQQALVIAPDNPQALNNLGASLHALGRNKQALGRFRQALALRPDFIDAQINLGHTFTALGRTAQAIPCYRAALAVQPANASLHLNLAGTLREAGRYAEAEAHFRQALAIEPNLAAAQAGLGTVLMELGRIDAARRCFDRAIAIEPHRPSHFLHLTRITQFTRQDRRLTQLLELAQNTDALTEADRIDAHFAAGKALADIGEQQRSFRHLIAGNRLKRRSIAYNETNTLGQIDGADAVFTTAFMQHPRDCGNDSSVPAFIVGMPRSGSTLVEQVLASHPQVFGAGEVQALRDALRANRLHTRAHPFPDSVPDWSDDQLRATAHHYLGLLQAAARPAIGQHAAARITDKTLSNFRYLGLIHLMLPNSRIIHITRDPIDTCLSCFSIQFAKLPFTYDLAELGRYYRAYHDLMQHWRTVLPPGRMIEIRYEDLVIDFEATARRLVTHCGLEWDDACRRFHQTRRPVRTASVAQVRQPLYRHAIARWRPNPDTLRPLLREMPAPITAPAPQATARRSPGSAPADRARTETGW